jgi:hypothetical protein
LSAESEIAADLEHAAGTREQVVDAIVAHEAS